MAASSVAIVCWRHIEELLESLIAAEGKRNTWNDLHTVMHCISPASHVLHILQKRLHVAQLEANFLLTDLLQ